MTITDVLEQLGSVQQVAKKAICAPRALNEAPDLRQFVFARLAHRPEWCEHPAHLRHGQHRRQGPHAFTWAISARSAAGPTRTSPRCWQPKAPRGRTSCAPPATSAISSATTPRSTKSGRRSSASRVSIRCRRRQAFRRSSAGPTCWSKWKPLPCSSPRRRSNAARVPYL